MNRRTFATLAGLTAVAVVAAGIGVSTRTGTTALTPGTEPAFPALAEAVNDVARIDVTTPGGSFSLTRAEDRWGLDPKDSYPAAFDKVKSAIVAVADLKLIEAKTADPERYARLDLGPPGEDGSESRRLVFRTADGGTLADVTIGKANPELFGAGGAGTYIRRGEEAGTWLARGEVAVGEEPIDWVRREIVDYGQERVRRVSLRGPEGGSFAIAKNARSDENFTLLDVPAGRRMKNDDEANPLGGVMWKMQFDDVRAAAGQDWPAAPWVARYGTWDGFTVRIEVAKIGEDHWGRFRASVDDAAEPEKREAARKTADEINARVAGWSYMLTAGDSEKLVSRVEDYLAGPEDDKDS